MVRLRPFKQSDFKYVLEWMQDERTFAMWCANKFDYPLTEEQLIAYKHRIEQEEFSWCFTAIQAGGLPIGHILMRSADYVQQSIHFGFVIIDPKYRGQGLGKEMMQQAVRYATDILHMKKITLGVFENNPGAHSCYQSIGFLDVNYRKEEFPYKDEQWGLYQMEYENR